MDQRKEEISHNVATKSKDSSLYLLAEASLKQPSLRQLDLFSNSRSNSKASTSFANIFDPPTMFPEAPPHTTSQSDSTSDSDSESDIEVGNHKPAARKSKRKTDNNLDSHSAMAKRPKRMPPINYSTGDISTDENGSEDDDVKDLYGQEELDDDDKEDFDDDDDDDEDWEAARHRELRLKLIAECSTSQDEETPVEAPGNTPKTSTGTGQKKKKDYRLAGDPPETIPQAIDAMVRSKFTGNAQGIDHDARAQAGWPWVINMVGVYTEQRTNNDGQSKKKQDQEYFREVPELHLWTGSEKASAYLDGKLVLEGGKGKIVYHSTFDNLADSVYRSESGKKKPPPPQAHKKNA